MASHPGVENQYDRRFPLRTYYSILMADRVKRPPARAAILLSVVVASLAVLLALVGVSSANSYWGHGYKSCRSFKAGGLTIHVSAKHISCRKARAIQKEYWNGPDSRKVIVDGGSGWKGYIKLKRYPGYKCTSGAGAGMCKKGRRIAAYDN